MPLGLLIQQIQEPVFVCIKDHQVTRWSARLGHQAFPLGAFLVHPNSSAWIQGLHSMENTGFQRACSGSVWQELTYCLRFTDGRTGVQRDEAIHPLSLQSCPRESQLRLSPLLRCLSQVRCYLLVRLTSTDNKKGSCLLNRQYVLSALTCLFPQQSYEVSAIIIIIPS